MQKSPTKEDWNLVAGIAVYNQSFNHWPMSRTEHALLFPLHAEHVLQKFFYVMYIYKIKWVFLFSPFTSSFLAEQ